MDKYLKRTSIYLLSTIALGLGACGTTANGLFDGPEAPPSVHASIQPPPPMPSDAAPPPLRGNPPRAALVEAAQPITPTIPKPVEANNAPAEIRSRLAAWRDAWAKREVSNYLSFYAPGFKGREASPESWQASRKRIIENAKGLEINLGEADIQQADTDHASATFTQQYRSSNKTDSGTKTLELRRIDGRWLIEQESFSAGRR